jgi:hypothetical protein
MVINHLHSSSDVRHHRVWHNVPIPGFQWWRVTGRWLVMHILLSIGNSIVRHTF